MERNTIEMNFFFEWEYDAKVDGLDGKFTGSEIVHIDRYEEVEKLIELTKKIMMKKRNGEITFRCVKFNPVYESNAMFRIASQFRNVLIVWGEGQEIGTDIEHEKWDAKTLKAIVLNAIEEYRERVAMEEWRQKEREAERQTA